MSLEPKTAYWLDYYRGVHGSDHGHLDYSNERVQAQSFGFALDALGPVHGRRCLDVGAGRGHFARMLLAAGASSVTAIELVQATVDKLRVETPQIEWRAGNAGDAASYAGMVPFDLVVALEVLQYVPLDETVTRLWSLVRPGGRLVGVIPNSACPVVKKTMDRFEGHFGAASGGDLVRAVGGLSDLEVWGFRGLHFATDQRIAPYFASTWMTAPSDDTPPNRFVFAGRRRGAEG